ncbi:hypothetical protein [Caldibacillus thermoamylovorans]|uniref:hypothetical protein n=1 Tax=Caldibacillus thermoamylovorans TaxID=35841 RepID=UPI001374DF15|nr:hypothetical protein [Caldibacillus thermoamylovorans]
MATRPVLVVILSRETPFFGDETLSRRRFEARNSFFWRRNHFSSSFLGRILPFLATKPVLVVILRRETPFFGDETLSRRRFEAGNSFFWRRDPFSSSFCGGEHSFLSTKLILVVVFGPETSFFGDETPSRRHFAVENTHFCRRNLFSSSFLGRKLHFLATRPLLVTILRRKTPFFSDETHSHSHTKKAPRPENPFRINYI